MSCCISVVHAKLIHRNRQTLRPRYYRTGVVGKMTSTSGKVDEFELEREYWTTYTERLEHFFNANGIEGVSKRNSVVLSVIGPNAYKVYMLKSLVSPDKPGDKEFDTLVRTMGKHYNPAPSEIVQRHKFHTRLRGTFESVSSCVFLSYGPLSSIVYITSDRP